jgi:diguanylate cyclase (GGDEF)-like protein
MHNEELAAGILYLLRERYPHTLPLREIKAGLREFPTSSHDYWVDTIYALHREGLVSAEFVFIDQSYQPVDVIHATITHAGREQGVKTEARLMSAPPMSVNELPNRDAMHEDIKSLLRHPKPFSVLFIDLDGFKNVNDSQGHQAGDQCLDAVVTALGETIQGKGKMYRYGGDEFVVSLPNFTPSEAEATAERIRAAIDELDPGDEIKIAASVGVAGCVHGQIVKLHDLVNAADQAMYESKRAGGNRVTVRLASTGPKGPLPRITRGNITRRVEAAQLSIALRQAVPQNYAVLVQNESDEKVLVRKLTLERNGVELTQPARPKAGEEWAIPPRTGKELAWSPAPDPVVTLQMSQSPPTSPIDIEIIIQCEILNTQRVLKRKMLVAADYKNRRLDPLGNW